MDKLVRDGMVAVIYSPGFGAGWSSWSSEHKERLIFDRDMALAVESGDVERLCALAAAIDQNIYTGGADQCQLGWLGEETQFRITEYDGFESIEIRDHQDWLVA